MKEMFGETSLLFWACVNFGLAVILLVVNDFYWERSAVNFALALVFFLADIALTLHKIADALSGGATEEALNNDD